MRPTAFAVLAVALFARVACAHPVAQGAMEVRVAEDHLDLHARVANEEAFVQDALGNRSTETEGGLDALLARHGQYLLQHVHLFADGTALTGTLLAVKPAETPTLEGRIAYDFHYAFPESLRRPRQIELRQDVLNELEFAPGNKWEATYVVRIQHGAAAGREGLLFTSHEPLTYSCDWASAAPIDTAPQLDRGGMFRAYLRHGVMHILSGYDHLLFMAGLVLAVASLMDLLKVVTAFTLAHTITLTLSVLNLVRLPSSIVEPMIAASIVVVALQNIFWPRQTHGWARLAVAFGFGLFHGLGFAGGLLEAMADLPGVAVAIAITSFSIGVELGHQAVVLPIFAGLQIARRVHPPREGFDPARYYAMKFGSALICAAGMIYFIAAIRA